MANYQQLATNYANNKVADYEKNLTASLLDPLKEQKAYDEAVLKEQYDKLISSLDYSGTKLQTQYATDAEAAYVNKQLSEQALKYQLNRLGLANTGTGVTQYYNLQTDYGANLATLGAALNEGLADIEQEKIGALSDYNAGLNQLGSDYLDRELDLKGKIRDKVDNYWQQEYNNYYGALMDEYNRYVQGQQLAMYGGDETNGAYKAGQRLITTYFDGTISAEHAKALNLYGALGSKGIDENGNEVYYQPAGIIGYGEIQGTNKKAKDYGIKTNSSGVNVSNQNVWKTNDGSLWIWNGSKMRYEKIDTKNKVVSGATTPHTSTSVKPSTIGSNINNFNSTNNYEPKSQPTLYRTLTQNTIYKNNLYKDVTITIGGDKINLKKLASGGYSESQTKTYLSKIAKQNVNPLMNATGLSKKQTEALIDYAYSISKQ